MKLGLISDIHADLTHLRRALALLRERGADVILCAGDLVDGETEGEAAARFFRQQNILCVQGNHDRLLSDPALVGIAERFPSRSGLPPSAEQLQADVVTNETIAYLRALPPSLRFEWDQRRVLLTHATTWDQATYVYSENPETLLRIAAEADADVVIVGHTHKPMAVEVKGTWIFNPGSVYGGRAEPYTPTCALLDLPITRYQVFDINTGQRTGYWFTKIGNLGSNMHQSETK